MGEVTAVIVEYREKAAIAWKHWTRKVGTGITTEDDYPGSVIVEDLKGTEFEALVVDTSDGVSKVEKYPYLVAFKHSGKIHFAVGFHEVADTHDPGWKVWVVVDHKDEVKAFVDRAVWNSSTVDDAELRTFISETDAKEIGESRIYVMQGDVPKDDNDSGISDSGKSADYDE